jgi:16S rRNA (cytidine1402-2'-O)-methyltransferase
VAVCRELTKLHEEVVRGTPAQVRAHFAEYAPRGEIVLVLAGGEDAAPPDTAVAADAVAELVAAGVARRQAAQVVARLTGVSANQLYRASL